MNPYIVTESCSGMRGLARQALKGNWKTAVLGVLIVSLIASGPSVLFNLIFPYSRFPFPGIYSLIITGPLTLGAISLFMSIFRWRSAKPEMVLSGFSQFGRALGIYLLTFLYTVLWGLAGLVPAIIISSILLANAFSEGIQYAMYYGYPDNFGLLVLVAMILIIIGCIPAIIASYRYSMALYIALDNPQIGCNEAITASKNIMKGNKKKFFFLHLSFIGWALLAAVPSMIWGASVMGSSMDYFMYSPELAYYYISSKAWVSSLLTFIPGLFLQSYVYSAQIAFYEILVGNLRMQGQEQIPPFNPNPSYPGGPGQPLSGAPQQPYYGQGYGQGYGQPQQDGQFGSQPPQYGQAGGQPSYGNQPYGQPPQNGQMNGQPLSGQGNQPGDVQPGQEAPIENQNINNESPGNASTDVDADKGNTEE